MSEICTKCGLPTELCVCETIAKENVKITVRMIKKKFGKPYTEILGIDDKGIDVRDVLKTLKKQFACGGAVKDGTIELQGSHIGKIKGALTALGFAEETIELKQR